LLIEDDRRLAASIQRGLGESGLAVDVVHEGNDGIAAVLSTPYDVVVMDVMLPGADGLSVSRQLRQQKVSAPILMLTARDAVPDRVAGLEAGADDYLVKPFAIQELVARLRALTRRRAQPGPLRSYADLSLATDSRTCTRAGRTVELTAREAALLELLLREAPRTVTGVRDPRFLHASSGTAVDQVADHRPRLGLRL